MLRGRSGATYVALPLSATKHKFHFSVYEHVYKLFLLFWCDEFRKYSTVIWRIQYITYLQLWPHIPVLLCVLHIGSFIIIAKYSSWNFGLTILAVRKRIICYYNAYFSRVWLNHQDHSYHYYYKLVKFLYFSLLYISLNQPYFKRIPAKTLICQSKNSCCDRLLWHWRPFTGHNLSKLRHFRGAAKCRLLVLKSHW